MRLAVLLVPSVLLLAPPLHAQKQFTLAGEEVAVYNLVGEVRVTASSGSAVTVTARPAGAQASALRFEQGELRGRQTLRVIYPDGDIVYPALGRNSETHETVFEDGTFNEGTKKSHGHRVRIVGSGRGTEAYTDLDIGVPRGAKVDIHLSAGKASATNVDGSLSFDMSSADVQVNGIKGDLSVDVGSGNVEVSRSEGDLSVDTGSGNVRLTDVRARSLSIDTGSGDVEVTGAVADVTDVDSGSGGISFTGSRTGRASFDTGSGDITVDLSEDPGDIAVDTGSGDVTLRLPATTGAVLSLQTSSGGIETEFPVQITRTASDELRGTIGDGRGRIDVESGSGDVRLQRR